MFYIHETCCISPQQTFAGFEIDVLNAPVENKLKVIEPSYEGIPKGLLRRMGKAVRIGVGTAMPLIQNDKNVSGIIIGTGNGGMEDSILFLKQIIEFDEGLLTPGNFVQSTPNAIGAQVGLLTQNKGYNITHVHRGLAFENAAIDAAMILAENQSARFLLGGVDEISSYNYKLDYMDGWYKIKDITGLNLYETNSPGCIAGEGAAMFVVDNGNIGAVAHVIAIQTLHTNDVTLIKNQLQQFIQTNTKGGNEIDLFLTGENGDNRYQHFFDSCESLVNANTTIARFKHMCGEHPTSSSFAVWITCQLLKGHSLPAHMIKKSGRHTEYKNVLIYNIHKGIQHSFILLSRPV